MRNCFDSHNNQIIEEYENLSLKDALKKHQANQYQRENSIEILKSNIPSSHNQPNHKINLLHNAATIDAKGTSHDGLLKDSIGRTDGPANQNQVTNQFSNSKSSSFFNAISQRTMQRKEKLRLMYSQQNGVTESSLFKLRGYNKNPTDLSKLNLRQQGSQLKSSVEPLHDNQLLNQHDIPERSQSPSNQLQLFLNQRQISNFENQVSLQAHKNYQMVPFRDPSKEHISIWENSEQKDIHTFQKKRFN